LQAAWQKKAFTQIQADGREARRSKQADSTAQIVAGCVRIVLAALGTRFMEKIYANSPAHELR
jgi:sulfur transfer protein SufE